MEATTFSGLLLKKLSVGTITSAPHDLFGKPLLYLIP